MAGRKKAKVKPASDGAHPGRLTMDPRKQEAAAKRKAIRKATKRTRKAKAVKTLQEGGDAPAAPPGGITGAATVTASREGLPPSLANLDDNTLEIYREAARQKLAVDTLSAFVRVMWKEIEPGRPLVWAWYLEVLCAELEGLARGVAPDGTPYPEEGAELVICIPPGHAKSRLCSVMFPAWLWLHIPHLRLITVANEGDLAVRDSRYSKAILQSDKFVHLQKRRAIDAGEAVVDMEATEAEARPILRPVVHGVVQKDQEWKPWGIAPDQAAKVNFDTEGGGGRRAQGITAKVTGKRAGGLIVDDPHDAREVLTGEQARIVERLREVRTIYHGALQSRLNAGAWRLVVAQRLHNADLPGDLIARGVRVVCLPAHYDPDHPEAYPGDQREPGQLLAPAVHSEAKDKSLRLRMGPKHHDAQYEQRPSKEAGGQFRREWFGQYYHADPLELAKKKVFDEVAISLDCSFRKTSDSDYVVATVWGHKRRPIEIDAFDLANIGPRSQTGTPEQMMTGIRPGKYLLDLTRGRMGLISTCRMLRMLRAKWVMARLVLVEARANGDAVIEKMRSLGHGGVVPFEPDKSKEARAELSALAFESGEVWLPLPERAPWLADYVEEHVQFPAGANDDQVDSTSQIFCRWALDLEEDIAGEFAWVNELGGLGR